MVAYDLYDSMISRQLHCLTHSRTTYIDWINGGSTKGGALEGWASTIMKRTSIRKLFYLLTSTTGSLMTPNG